MESEDRRDNRGMRTTLDMLDAPSGKVGAFNGNNMLDTCSVRRCTLR